MQGIAINQTVISLTLVGLVLFGMLYALLVRWLAERKMNGYTAFLVVGGVAVTLLAFIPTLGLETVAVLFVGFGASGLPMIVEYVARVEARRKADADAQAAAAREIVLDILDGTDDR